LLKVNADKIVEDVKKKYAKKEEEVIQWVIQAK
jgi:hypothetical protein